LSGSDSSKKDVCLQQITNFGLESANNGIKDYCRSIDCATSAAPRIWRTSSAPADKPKGMHWRTYERKVASWTRAVERVDEAFIR
jgi:hypothetical protein